MLQTLIPLQNGLSNLEYRLHVSSALGPLRNDFVDGSVPFEAESLVMAPKSRLVLSPLDPAPPAAKVPDTHTLI